MRDVIIWPTVENRLWQILPERYAEKMKARLREQLNEVNVDGVEPLTGAAQMALKMREDVVTDGGYADKILANAPERAGDFYVVPKVVE